MTPEVILLLEHLEQYRRQIALKMEILIYDKDALAQGKVIAYIDALSALEAALDCFEKEAKCLKIN